MTLSVATGGHLPLRSPICLATMGYLCGEAVEDVGNSAGGNYGGRALPSLADYENRIKNQLDKERDERLIEAKATKNRLIQLEAEKALFAKKEEIRQIQENELKLLIVSESLLQIKRDLAEIAKKRAEISLRARIMRDDDEVMILLYG